MYKAIDVKEAITTADVFAILEYVGAEPRMNGDNIVSRTVCHNGDSHKLFYYGDSSAFHCYSDSCGTFDIFDLVEKTLGYDFAVAINFVVDFCGLQNKVDSDFDTVCSDDWEIIESYQSYDAPANKGELVLPEIDEAVIARFPKPYITDWCEEGIAKDVCDAMGVCYNPESGCILIPHRDKEGRLIGIRERTLVKENEVYGKYRPAVIDGKMYNHPLGFNMFGLDVAKDAIGSTGTAVVVEGEKTVYKSLSYFGNNSLAVATCGSSISNYQMELLIGCGAREIVVAFDSDYKEPGDDDFMRVVEHLQKINEKFSSRITMSFMFDKTKTMLPYKASPFDCGKDVFLTLWKDRVRL